MNMVVEMRLLEDMVAEAADVDRVVIDSEGKS